MKNKIIITVLLLVLYINAIFSNEKRNLLENNYTRKYVQNALVENNNWVKYPTYNDRTAWQNIPEETRKATIASAEQYLKYDWPLTTATMYLQFVRTGDRAIVDNAIRQRLTVLRLLTMAELMEGKGRFLDDLINGVFSFCEQTYWGMSATFYMYKTGSNGHDNPNTVLPDIDDPVVDLSVGDAAADLAWIYYFFHNEFDKISPVISKRLKSELKKKVLEPFYERFDFWWITGWDVGNVNNWNPWCNYNVLTCIMLMEEDSQKKLDGIYKTMKSVDLFINSYPLDGGCDEGPSYWEVAGGKLFDYLHLLGSITGNKINIFNDEVIKNIGRYISRVCISSSSTGQYYANYSDSPAKIRLDPGRIIRYGIAINDPVLKDFGNFILFNSESGNARVVGRIGECLENLFNSEADENFQKKGLFVTEYYLTDTDIAIARENKENNGFCFVAKGGSNGEGHNHNDVGSCMLFYNGTPVLIDVGVGTYTAQTFSSQRYSIWTMQSNYHNLPLINGIGQSPGGQFRAMNSKFSASPKTVTYSTDISKAYPVEANVSKWIRKYTLERGSHFAINDQYLLNGKNDELKLHFMTPFNIRLIQPGIVELKTNDIVLYLRYNPSVLAVEDESISLDDDNLKRVWGNHISRLVFISRNKQLTGDFSIKITKK